MANLKISQLTDGGDVQADDYIPAVRSGANVKVKIGATPTVSVNGVEADSTGDIEITAADIPYTNGPVSSVTHVDEMLDYLNRYGGGEGRLIDATQRGISPDNTAAQNSDAADILNEECAETGRGVRLPFQELDSSGNPRYYDFSRPRYLRNAHAGWFGDNPDRAQVRNDHTGGVFHGFVVDTYKGLGTIFGMGHTNINTDKSNAANMFVRLGDTDTSGGSVLQANIACFVGYNKFRDGSRFHVYSSQECDQTVFRRNESFSNIGASGAESHRILLEMNDPHGQAPSACVRFELNHFSQETGSYLENKFGITVIGSDICSFDGDIVNNHGANYVSWSPSNASFRENASIRFNGAYCEEQRSWVKNAPYRTNNESVTAGTFRRIPKSTGEANGVILRAQNTGTTAGSPPTLTGSGIDNYGPGLSTSTIVDGGVTWEIVQASIGFIVSGNNRIASFESCITKALIAAFSPGASCRLDIRNHNKTAIGGVDHDAFHAPRGFQQGTGYTRIYNSITAGNLKPYRLAATDTQQFVMDLDHTIISTDSIGLFPTEGYASWNYGNPQDSGYMVDTQQNKTNNTLAVITELLCPRVMAGKKYKFKATLYTTSNTGAGVKFAMNGSATATLIIAEAMVTQGGAVQTPGTSRVSALNTTLGDITAVSAAKVEIEGTITVNAAGTFGPYFAQNVTDGANQSSILPGSTFEIELVN